MELVRVKCALSLPDLYYGSMDNYNSLTKSLWGLQARTHRYFSLLSSVSRARGEHTARTNSNHNYLAREHLITYETTVQRYRAGADRGYDPEYVLSVTWWDPTEGHNERPVDKTEADFCVSLSFSFNEIHATVGPSVLRPTLVV